MTRIIYKFLNKIENYLFKDLKINDSKVIEEIKINNFEVLTDTGYKPITHVYKTIKFKKYKIFTEKNKKLCCADEHIVYNGDFNQVYVKNLNIGDEIITKDGIEKIKKIKIYNKYENMFDVTVNDVNHRLYTNDILSHNSTVSFIFVLWYTIFNGDKTACILANKEATATEIFNRLLTSYQYLPNYLKPGCKEFSKTQVSFDNGSRVLSSSTSSSSVRGYSIQLLLCDEISHIPYNLFTEFWNSIVPTISKAKDGRIIGVTTANGMNFFYKLWQDAKRLKNDFKTFEAKWYEIPGRDSKFKEKMISELGLQGWKQEFENEFIGSQNTLIDPDVIKNLVYHDPIKFMLENNLKIYKEPIEDHLYVCGVDIAEGTGNDYSVIQVVDVTKYPFKQSAVYRCNTIKPMLLGNVVTMIARMYNNAHLVIETNSIGREVADDIWFNIEYQNMYNEEKEIGVRTTKLTKSQGLITFKELLECAKLILHDLDTINELGTFILKSNKTYSAQDNAHDDTVMALSLICLFLRTEEFKDIYKHRDLKKELYDKQIDKLHDDFCLPVYCVTDDNVETSEPPDFLKTLFEKEGVLLYEEVD